VSGVEELLVRRHGAVAWLTLNRPAVRNAIGLALRTALADRLTGLAADTGVHALVLTGAGPGFCAGGDVAELAEPRTDAQTVHRIGEGNRMIRALYEFPVPTIAAVNGTAAGAGCSLAMACDLVVAAASARFRFSFVGMGLGPDAGASVLLPARVGLVRAKELFFRGTPLTAAEAHTAGLVDYVVPDEDLMAYVTGLAEEFSGRSRPALVASKRLVNDWVDLAGALGSELAAQAGLMSTVEHQRARDAFLHRRAEVRTR
jgi:2-(1,2-epoxy-1,2-dihydrophenyl)acetyl-CoA isomerase